MKTAFMHSSSYALDELARILAKGVVRYLRIEQAKTAAEAATGAIAPKEENKLPSHAEADIAIPDTSKTELLRASARGSFSVG